MQIHVLLSFVGERQVLQALLLRHASNLPPLPTPEGPQNMPRLHVCQPTAGFHVLQTIVAPSYRKRMPFRVARNTCTTRPCPPHPAHAIFLLGHHCSLAGAPSHMQAFYLKAWRMRMYRICLRHGAAQDSFLEPSHTSKSAVPSILFHRP